MSIRLIATDLDGTLLRSDKSISERTAVAMERSQAAGVMVVWATARARATVIDFAAMGRANERIDCLDDTVAGALRTHREIAEESARTVDRVNGIDVELRRVHAFWDRHAPVVRREQAPSLTEPPTALPPTALPR